MPRADRCRLFPATRLFTGGVNNAGIGNNRATNGPTLPVSKHVVIRDPKTISRG